MPKTARLDLVLFGATGFTGSIAAKYIAKFGAKSLQWAIAARSQDKLNGLVKQLSKEFPASNPPETIIASLDEESAVRLATSCKAIITTVGPYCRYGSGLVKACAEAGTHYVDCTGEHPWVLDMIEKYDETARKNGAIIVPQCAFESAPADLTSRAVANHIRKKYNCGTRDIAFALHKLNGGASGGTIETFLSVIESFSFSFLARSSSPLALSPIDRPYSAPPGLPVFNHPTLGTLAPWVQATPDRAIVLRSWGLTQKYAPQDSYGDNFAFVEYKRVRNLIEGWALCFTIAVLSVGVIFPPFRWIARKVVAQPGSGPDQNFDKDKREKLEWRAVGTADDKSGKKVFGSFKFDDGDAYALTALLIVEAAFAILGTGDEGVKSDTKSLAKEIGGGILTPASLGDEYVVRLESAGIKIDTKDL
ncbi:hypothetical protein ABW19_dt0205455 [Dactylella cylindrospora]|nr:hypothetical protein ABW19_dt0205455 [Dactylella cylindrospora]